MSAREGTQCVEPPKVPTVKPEVGEGSNSAAASSSKEVADLSYLGLIREPGHKSVTALNTLVRILTSQKRNLIAPYDCIEEAILHSFWHSL